MLDLEGRLRNYHSCCMPQKRSTKKKLSRKETRELDIKIEFLQGLLRRDPAYIDALQQIGDLHTRRGQFEAGLKIDEQLCALAPADPLVFYNLACSCSLTSQMERAAAALEKSITLGYRDFKWLAKDPDLRAFRQHPAFRLIENQIHRIQVA